MILTGEDALKKHIKQNTPARLYFIYGDEDYLKSNYSLLLASKITDTSGSGFNFYQFNSEMTFDMFYEACESLPMMADRICVFVKDLPLNKLTDAEIKDYEKLLSNLPETTTVIFSMVTVPVDKNTVKWKNIIDMFSKYGVCAELSKRNMQSMIKMLVSRAEQAGCSISSQNAQYLINAAGDDLNRLLGEFDKLCAYASKREITADMIDKVAVRSVEASVFNIAKAINSSDGDKAYKLLSELLKQKTDPTLIVGVLAGEYADLYRMKMSDKYGGSLREISTEFSYKNKEFRLKNASRLCKNYSEKRIKKIMETIADTDIKIKTSGADKTMILEELIAKLLLLTEKTG